MDIKINKLIIGIIIFGAGIFVGREIGAHSALKKQTKLLQNIIFYDTAKNLNSHITLLKSIHANDIAKCDITLESLVDFDLMALAYYADVPPPERENHILTTIAAAKAYRQENPKKYRDEYLAGAAKKVFELVK